MLLALLFACTNELSSTPKINTFRPLLILPLLKVPPLSIHIPYPYLDTISYLEVSAFLVISIAPNNAF